MAAQLGGHGGLSKGYAYLVLVLICIYAAGFAWNWGSLGSLVGWFRLRSLNGRLNLLDRVLLWLQVFSFLLFLLIWLVGFDYGCLSVAGMTPCEILS